MSGTLSRLTLLLVCQSNHIFVSLKCLHGFVNYILSFLYSVSVFSWNDNARVVFLLLLADRALRASHGEAHTLGVPRPLLLTRQGQTNNPWQQCLSCP